MCASMFVTLWEMVPLHSFFCINKPLCCYLGIFIYTHVFMFVIQGYNFRLRQTMWKSLFTCSKATAWRHDKMFTTGPFRSFTSSSESCKPGCQQSSIVQLQCTCMQCREDGERINTPRNWKACDVPLCLQLIRHCTEEWHKENWSIDTAQKN